VFFAAVLLLFRTPLSLVGLVMGDLFLFGLWTMLSSFGLFLSDLFVDCAVLGLLLLGTGLFVGV